MMFAAVNYVAIGEALGVSPSVLAAGVDADNVICAVYFVVLFTLDLKIPAEASTLSDGKYFLSYWKLCDVEKDDKCTHIHFC